jgi:hypothetical protein
MTAVLARLFSSTSGSSAKAGTKAQLREANVLQARQQQRQYGVNQHSIEHELLTAAKLQCLMDCSSSSCSIR